MNHPVIILASFLLLLSRPGGPEPSTQGPSADVRQACSYLDGIVEDPTEKLFYQFPWLGMADKPFLSANQSFVCEALVSLADLDQDGTDEIILSANFYHWAIPVNQILSVSDTGIHAAGGFLGNLGSTREDPLGRGANDILIYAAENGEQVVLQWTQTSMGGATYDALLRVSLPDMAYTPVVACMSSYMDGSADPVYFQFPGLQNCPRKLLEMDFLRQASDHVQIITEEAYELEINRVYDVLTPVARVPFCPAVSYNLSNLPALDGRMSGPPLYRAVSNRNKPVYLMRENFRIVGEVYEAYRQQAAKPPDTQK